MQTLYDKLWEAHVIRELGDGASLLYIARSLMYETMSPVLFDSLRKKKQPARDPRNNLAVYDHMIPTRPGSRDRLDQQDQHTVDLLVANASEFQIPLIPLRDDRQGIVHVVGPEQGFSLPGLTICCSDSHTSTNGAFGALAFGVGISELTHIVATRTLVQRRAKTLRVNLEGRAPAHVSAKDFALAVISHIGAGGGTGYAIEYAGDAVRALSMEGRMTLCNMAIEGGARSGIVAPDETTFNYLHGRPMAPQEQAFDEAMAFWKTLPSDPGAVFDREVTIDVSRLAPQVTWGISPEHAVGIDERVPDPKDAADSEQEKSWRQALEYMDLHPNQRVADIEIDRVFIGSCTNSRLDDLRAAAAVLRGRRLAPGVQGMVTPGSGLVRKAAEAEGLDVIFKDAGMEWRLPGCSMCFSSNYDKVEAGERCASTSNRNFANRQGSGARTHLVSPAMAAAAGVAGRFVDIRNIPS